MLAALAQAKAAPAAVPRPAAAAAPVAPAPQAVPAYKIRRTLPLDKTVATPGDWVKLALADAKTLDPHEATYVRYVPVPEWIEPASGFAQVSLVANSTFSRTSNIIQPDLVTSDDLPGVVLVRVNLAKYASFEHQIPEIVALWERLAVFDSWFNVQVKVIGDVAVIVDPTPLAGAVVEILLADGNWGSAKFVSILPAGKATVNYHGKPHTIQAANVRWNGQPLATHSSHIKFTAAPYLGADGAELFTLLQSSVPIMRLDEFVAFTFSSVNGGLYYELTGIGKDLESTIANFCGEDAAAKIARATAAIREAEIESKKTGKSISSLTRFDPELAKNRALIYTSAVTGRQRLALLAFGSSTSPAQGPQWIAVTFDIGEDNFSVESDPARNVQIFERYDGGEAIFSLPNGLLAYLVFNRDDKIIASVPDNVAHDFRAREVRSNVATARVFAGLSCAHCHDFTAGATPNWGWQPLHNDLYDTINGLSKITGDSAGRDRLRSLQVIAANYSMSTEDLTGVLGQARVTYQRQAQLATNQTTSRETVFGLAESYWSYYYDQITPELAARDLGQSLSAEKSQLFLLNAIDPAPGKSPFDFLREDGIVARIKDGKHVMPAQWRPIYPSVAERLLRKKNQIPSLELEGVKP